MDSYDLFSAMSGADENLVARSDYRVPHRSQGFTFLLTAAACLAIAVIGIISLSLRTDPDAPIIHLPLSTYETVPVGSEPTDINHKEPLKLNGGDVGTLNIVQLSNVEEAVTMPEFLMYIDSENYYPADDGSNFYIYQRSRSEGKPACWLTLSWKANSTVEQALQQQSTDLSALMENVTVFDSNPLLNGPMIQGSSGSGWDSQQTEVYFVSDQQNGVFVFTLQFYLDDTDGHAIRLRDMLQTFEIITDDKAAPAWMTDLRSSVDDFTAAFLMNDFSNVQSMIAKNADIFTYEKDVLSGTRVLKTHYTVDDDATPTSATVSVRHKYLEQDAYDYITMELNYIDGNWQVVWAGIER